MFAASYLRGAQGLVLCYDPASISSFNWVKEMSCVAHRVSPDVEIMLMRVESTPDAVHVVTKDDIKALKVSNPAIMEARLPAAFELSDVNKALDSMVARRAPQFLAHCEEKEKTLETLILCLEKKLHPTEATPFEKFSSWSKWVFYGSGDLGSSRPPQLEGIEKIDYLEDTMGLIGDYLA